MCCCRSCWLCQEMCTRRGHCSSLVFSLLINILFHKKLLGLQNNRKQSKKSSMVSLLLILIHHTFSIGDRSGFLVRPVKHTQSVSLKLCWCTMFRMRPHLSCWNFHWLPRRSRCLNGTTLLSEIPVYPIIAMVPSHICNSHMLWTLIPSQMLVFELFRDTSLDVFFSFATENLIFTENTLKRGLVIWFIWHELEPSELCSTSSQKWCIPAFIVKVKVAYLDASADCVKWQRFPDVHLSWTLNTWSFKGQLVHKNFPNGINIVSVII